jgi:replicative DNA helicase
MGKEQLTQRMLCSVANVSMAKALRGELGEADWARIWEADKKLKDADIFIDDNAMNTPAQVLSKCRKLKREKGLDLVVIDYLGLMKSDEKTDNRQNEVASISRQLKILAKEIEVPVLTLCQLNRSVESRADGKPGRPVLSDLRDSGSIEQDADMVWFIHRDMAKVEDANNPNSNYTAELIIAKFRNGQPGSVYLGWDGSRTSFTNLEKDANEQSLVGIYEKNEDIKKAKKRDKDSVSPEDLKDKAGEIFNEIDLESSDGLEPPPEWKEEPPVDFSNVQIPSDDELF